MASDRLRGFLWSLLFAFPTPPPEPKKLGHTWLFWVSEDGILLDVVNLDDLEAAPTIRNGDRNA